MRNYHIIGGSGWTDIWCVCCHEHKPIGVSFGERGTVEVCEPCLRSALADLEKAKVEK